MQKIFNFNDCITKSYFSASIKREDSYATADVAQSHSFQDAILPVAQIVIEDFNNQVVDYYYPGYTIQIADTEPRKELEEAQRAATLYKEGLITKNESRRMVGEPLLEGCDTFFDGSSPGTVKNIDKKNISNNQVAK